MQRDRFVVVDVHYVVDLALELSGVQTGRRAEIESMINLFGRTVVLEDEVVHVRPLLSEHIYRTAKLVLGRRLSPADAQRFALGAAKYILRCDGEFDATKEDYWALSRRAWVRCGTDAEDEAVLACAERYHASVLTRDADFRQYLSDRKVATFTAVELVSASMAIH